MYLKLQQPYTTLKKKKSNKSCKDQFWLEPKIGMDPGPKSPNNKFVESGRKS